MERSFQKNASGIGNAFCSSHPELPVRMIVDVILHDQFPKKVIILSFCFPVTAPESES
jgi:hypothetical protein